MNDIAVETAIVRATYSDILALPEHVTGEIIDGRLYTQPRPSMPHGLVATTLAVALVNEFGVAQGRADGWFFVVEPELHLRYQSRESEDVLVPDIAGWSQNRLPPDARRGAFVTVVPDWVCEILSPSTARRDRQVKAPAYASHGVRHLWLVDPIVGTVDAYGRDDDESTWRWLGSWSDADAKIPPFDAVGLDLAAIWAMAGG